MLLVWTFVEVSPEAMRHVINAESMFRTALNIDVDCSISLHMQSVLRLTPLPQMCHWSVYTQERYINLFERDILGRASHVENASKRIKPWLTFDMYFPFEHIVAAFRFISMSPSPATRVRLDSG